jgi:hypothetical protein
MHFMFNEDKSNFKRNRFGIKMAWFMAVFPWCFLSCSSLIKTKKNVGNAELTSQEKIKERKQKLKNMGPCINKLHNQIENQWKMSSFSEEETGYAAEFLNVMIVNYENYLTDSVVLSQLRGEGNFLVRIFGGNWCSDTHAGVPALYKALDEMNFSANKVEYNRVGRNKKPVDISFGSEGVGPVPLVIVMSTDGKEIGRIVEVPKKSWEADLLGILQSTR